MKISFYKGLTRNPEIVCSISGDWVEQGIPNLTWTFLIKFYWMLQNARVIAFTVSDLLRENQPGVEQGGGGKFNSKISRKLRGASKNSTNLPESTRSRFFFGWGYTPSTLGYSGFSLKLLHCRFYPEKLSEFLKTAILWITCETSGSE